MKNTKAATSKSIETAFNTSEEKIEYTAGLPGADPGVCIQSIRFENKHKTTTMMAKLVCNYTLCGITSSTHSHSSSHSASSSFAIHKLSSLYNPYIHSHSLFVSLRIIFTFCKKIMFVRRWRCDDDDEWIAFRISLSYFCRTFAVSNRAMSIGKK